jgi:hypothetical protein
MTVTRGEKPSAVLTIRVDAGLGGEGGALDLAQEARRQSLLGSSRRSEGETLDFIEQAADTHGWE